MKKFYVEGWLHHIDERWYPKGIGFYFYAKDRKEAKKIARQYNWIWWQIEEFPK